MVDLKLNFSTPSLCKELIPMKILLIFILLFLTSCASFSSYEVHRDIVGSWSLQDYGENAYEFTHIGFLENGRKCVITFEINAHGNIEPVYYDGKWEIDGKYLVTTAVKNTSQWSRPGSKFKDEILLLKGNTLNLLYVSKSEFYEPKEERHVRLTDVAPERICQIVERFVH